MNSVVSKLKKSLIIGIIVVILLSSVSTKILPQSWFITGSFFYDETNDSVTVINQVCAKSKLNFYLYINIKIFLGHVSPQMNCHNCHTVTDEKNSKPPKKTSPKIRRAQFRGCSFAASFE
jgi:hypothetical protein